MKLFRKAFNQKTIKYMVALSDYNASVVEFVGSVQPQPLMPSQIAD